MFVSGCSMSKDASTTTTQLPTRNKRNTQSLQKKILHEIGSPPKVRRKKDILESIESVKIMILVETEAKNFKAVNTAKLVLSRLEKELLKAPK